MNTYSPIDIFNDACSNVDTAVINEDGENDTFGTETAKLITGLERW